MCITYRLKKIMDAWALLPCKWIFIKSHMFCASKWVNGISILAHIHYMSIICINFMMAHDNFLVNDRLIRSDLLISNFGPRGH